MTLFQIISSKHVTFVALARKNSEVCYLKLKLKILKLATYHSPPSSWDSLANCSAFGY